MEKWNDNNKCAKYCNGAGCDYSVQFRLSDDWNNGNSWERAWNLQRVYEAMPTLSRPTAS